MNAIPYGRQNITQEDINAVTDCLQSDFLTQGPRIKEFEDNFANYVGSKYAVAVSNGTAALHLGVLALGLNEGDKVITTPITFAASANCIRYAGAEVVFADIDPTTYLIDLNSVKKILEEDIDNEIKGIIPVDFTGLPVNVEALRNIANQYDVWILEDACHAPGGYITDSQEQKHFCGSGEYVDIGVFSFHPVKHIAAGEGGMITTNSEELYKKLLTLRTHGITKDNMSLNIAKADQQGLWYYEQQELGYNYRMTDIQAALGNSQLTRAEDGVVKRNSIAQKYYKAFEGTKVRCQTIPQNTYHAYHLFVIEVENRKGLYDFLREQKIYSQIHYIPVHLMPYYQELGWKEGDCPDAENYYKNCLSLPMYPTLTDEEQQFVIDQVLKFCE